MVAVLWVMIGGTIGFFAACLCRVAGRADSLVEKMDINFIPNLSMETSKEIAPEQPNKVDD
jgi:hypothetical protein